MPELSKTVRTRIGKIVECYRSRRGELRAQAENLHRLLMEDICLRRLIHSTMFREKDPGHLRDKLERLAIQAKHEHKELDVNVDNVFGRISDLAGVRLLHLHTRQMTEIHPAIMGVFDEHKYILVGEPVANVWDDESEDFFRSIGIGTVHRGSMYMSVHYDVMANRKTSMRIELQVRTLVEEVYGEVSHAINYPHPSSSVACREQLKVLARVGSGCTRLVDSIFASHAESVANAGDAAQQAPKRTVKKRSKQKDKVSKRTR